ncbi:MAG: NosD domain-containing protein [Rickettsiales bacterium]|nr:NosD domain-containing protein [Rickettsiales bacterium]
MLNVRIPLSGLACLLVLLNTPAQASDAGTLWLEAEALSSKPTQAIAKWTEVLKLIPKGKTAGEGLTHEAAKLQLFHSLLNAAEQSKDIKLIQRAQKLSEDFSLHQKIFADTLAGKTTATIDKKIALKTLKAAKKNALTIKDRRKKSEALHAIALAMLTKNKDNKLLFSWDGVELAEDITPYITLSKHRAELMQMLAHYQRAPSDSWGKKLHELTRITGKKETKQRNTQLIALHAAALKSDKFTVALNALSAITDHSKQQEKLYQWFKKTFEQKNLSRAAMIADRIDDGKYGANSWGKLAVHYYEAGEKVRANDAIEKSYRSALSTRRDDRKVQALIETADYAAHSNNPKLAQKALDAIGAFKSDIAQKGETPKLSKAFAAFIKSLAENGRFEEAQNRLSATKFSDSANLTLAVTAVAKSLAENGNAQAALSLLENKNLMAGNRLDKAYYATAKALTMKQKFLEARTLAGMIKDAKTKIKIQAYIDSKAKAAAKEKETSALQAPFFSSLNLKIKTLPAAQQEAARLELAEMFIAEPALPIAQWATLITSAEAKDTMIALRSIHLAKAGKIEEASRLMKSVSNAIRRAKHYRRLAKEISLHTDLFGFIGDKVDPIIEETKQNIFNAADATQIDSKALEVRLDSFLQSKKPGLELAAPTSSNLGLTIPEMDFPERLEFDYDYVKAQLPALTPFTLDRVYYENSFFINTKFKIAIAYSDNNFESGNISPEVLYISSGTTSLPLLYDRLKSQGLEGYITRKGKEYTLNNGLLIGPDATLVIDGEEVSKLYQSKQASAILVNAGRLYITGTSVIGWDVNKAQPAFAQHKDRYDFRPFIAGWSRSHTYLAGNEFVAIGYSNHKSYGISLSAGPEKLQQSTITEPQRPDGIIVDNSFENVYYGFYSYEADNVSLIGNEYKDNIIYGIDPHDRSRWLTIAYNTAYGAQKKHGIIISREVNDSSYIGNLSFDNKGSGFMIDRLSNGTFVYGNTAFGNGQDGLTVFESSCNFISSNSFFKNKSMGLRIRNSQDNGIYFNNLAHNKQGGVSGYISELLNDPAHKRRNFTLDPYSDVAAMTLVGNKIEANGTGVIGEDLSALFLRGNRFINQAPKQFNGKWFNDHSYFTSQYDLKNKGAFLGEKCPKGKWIHHDCRFRKDGLYRGDAQKNLKTRVKSSSCQVQSKQDAHS